MKMRHRMLGSILLFLLLAGMGAGTMLVQPQSASAMSALNETALIERTEAGDNAARLELARHRCQNAAALLEQYQANKLPDTWKNALLQAASAVDLNPDNAMGWQLLGAVYLANPDRLSLQNAENALLQALKIQPKLQMSQLLLGQVYLLQRRFYSARYTLLPLVADAPSPLVAKLTEQLLQAYALSGDVKAGLKEVSDLRKQAPKNLALATLYTALLDMQATAHPDEAMTVQRQHIARWWQTNPDAPASLKQFVRTHYLEGVAQ